jgi:hypothetical protein
VLGLIDVALVGAIGSADPPPLAVSLGVAALGLITLAALVPAYRGSRSALGTVVVVRVISALLAVPAFFLSAPPGSWSSRASSSWRPPPPSSCCTATAANCVRASLPLHYRIVG